MLRFFIHLRIEKNAFMKRTIAILTFLFFTIAVMAQEKVGVYHSSYFDKDLEVMASYSSSNELSIYVQVVGKHSSDDVQFNFKGSAIDDFISALQQSKEKFLEWKSIAEQNNVKKMRKDFDISFPRTTVAWYGSQWWFCFSHRLSPEFFVTENGDCLFLMTDKVTSSRNEYIDMTYYFALSKASDFDELIDTISPANIEEKFSKKKDVQDLFK